ncbi:YdeI/OmpD-associated family protein [Rhizobium halophytocola]|uniref:Uncharacterized protein YdeI (YjbR/CyaY-like superfamily) n=1 Tax=Rhizobium halophytocola TaxID=735519 RepID=A0ABS4DTN2_9HYPH|nr:YdeI/OmpD-associated family protein [Rhizobium halophytocola]MBP1849039.1 uncharacterized protein YdeI (YjbR/CyaY-like superfamily) [Rhizobium halophytocola]
MTRDDPRIEAYFSKSGRWQSELQALRSLLSETPLVEDFKWRSPCYTFDGANVATIWAMKEACGLSFFKGVLLKDPAGILTAPGDNSRSVRLFRFSSLEQLAPHRDTLKGYVLEAIGLEKAGAKVTFEKDDLAYPAELVDRLDADTALREAFEALTPGRRRGYLLHFTEPKQPATRTARIDRHADRILAGKGMHDR